MITESIILYTETIINNNYKNLPTVIPKVTVNSDVVAIDIHRYPSVMLFLLIGYDDGSASHRRFLLSRSQDTGVSRSLADDPLLMNSSASKLSTEYRTLHERPQCVLLSGMTYTGLTVP
jgi:hypothetical protein